MVSLVQYKSKETLNENNKIVQYEWDMYWSKKKKVCNVVYDVIAHFYRKFIISKILTHFIRKYFWQGQHVLHAGCGSGEVDEGIIDFVHITALDISLNALDIYRNLYKDKCKVVQGDIFRLPFPDKIFDGIYNLGVMEHFTEEEIHKILLEFYRVLKPQAKMVIFWPPVFGLTVNVLDFSHFILNKIFRNKIKLHPDEITRVRSKQQMKNIFEKNGFTLVEYYFGIRDFFTHVVIVAEKHDAVT